jgi:hypothetical protein
MNGIQLNGRSTTPDIETIIKNYPVESMEIGKEIAKNDIAECISTPNNTHRYHTVTSAWRKKLLRDHNIYIGVIDKKFVVQSNSQRIERSSAKIKSGLRSVVRGGNLANKTSTLGLTYEEIKTRDHCVNISATMKGLYDVRKRDLREDLRMAIGDKK